MKSVKHFLLGLFLSACTSKGRLIEYRENITIIDLPSHSLAPHCSDDPNSQVSFFSVEGTLDEVIYDFGFRSPVDRELCQELMIKYNRLIDGTRKPLHISGEGPHEEPYKVSSDSAKITKLGPFRKRVWATFIRIEGDSGCLAYFKQGCQHAKATHYLVPGKVLPKP